MSAIQSDATAVFQAVLSGAKGLNVYGSITRDHPAFDQNLGAILADRIEPGSRSELRNVLTTAVLLSHCAHVAALRFVLDAIYKGECFGVFEESDGVIRAEESVSMLVATMDIQAIAQGCAMRGDLAQDCGPFRGPAQILWDAGFQPHRFDDAELARAREELTRRVLNTWALQSDGELPWEAR